MDLEALRREYLKDGLERENLADDPFDQFEKWMAQFLELGLADPTAMTVATVAPDGQPSQRIVLLKHVDQSGFVFYTNYSSRKANEIDANPKISLHFPWHAVERQVKVCGVAEKVSPAESLRYFTSRPKGSQLAAAASPQSKVISSRTLLLNEFERLKQKFREGEIPLPDFWGGYRVVPSEIEFWQGGQNRLHDRFRYTRSEDAWEIDRLAP
ncbi:MAG TPA: pyridoxamine 5'-phosphate oxidase [Gammaproteobacteria bacterium]|jgi:pyridoxamine 5'-phosphate oxidase|nr:pyridoxamine 5'-phosphate oxidase [Gammaproteobacteria bacterium]RPG43552.1 MAG: pyridoxamine 5'-phosphate oxidase [Gammaproteobacteria bacterium TMED163]HAO87478.1 pyridoxamine 5'-phosphate oxidase [Gammaproteobacteria bacterium]HAR90753.1 pyridoxamine 5'-phosphate oxidase [Gammaproteobacteria bacterium]HBJ90589.1 pyridoxamine 5'-phosphate oxidase [Gammaproteobacteria bacterium]|tara:strand:+ start:115 stop:750 length:636 start_codon:yes stop_codon:yes gene_type:complete